MTSTDTYLLLRAFVDELARCGMRHACTSPGSRNTPLVLSLAREPRLAVHSHIDERCAGFFALGAAKASQRAVAVTVTSGTAVLNLAPAVVEAWEAQVPLIVLSADRPPELRQIGAGQTVDQLKVFGDAVKWFFEVGVQEATTQRMRWIRTLACRAYLTATTGSPGPVHLNFPLQEPLILDSELPTDDSGRAGGAPYVSVLPPRLADHSETAGVSGRRTLVVAGGGAPAGVAAAAGAAGVPLLADPLSGARSGPAAVAHYDLIVRDRGWRELHRPDLVVRVGELPTSKPLRTWLSELPKVHQVAVDPLARWHDPGSVVGERLPSLPPLPAPEKAWLAAWKSADDAAAAAVRLSLGSGLSEPAVARSLVAELPAEATLWTAASMPVRDLEEFAAVRDDPPRVLANRGANGIDGTVSAAYGAAAAGDGPVVLLIGDVALLHDIGGLLAASRLGLALTIVLLDNDGGGIFEFLPVASQGGTYTEHVATPHGIEFSRAAALYGLNYAAPAGLPEFAAQLHRALAAQVSTLVHVRTDRRQNLELHRRVAAALTL